MNHTLPIILASASPRRRDLLNQIGVCYEVLPVDIDETPRVAEAPTDFVRRLALEKAEMGYRRKGTGQVALGSDTVVLLNNQILGKPRDQAEGVAMLSALSGCVHEVLTAVAMVDSSKKSCLLNSSKVFFRQLSDTEIQAYWASGEPRDKAGAYAIQGLAAQFIQRIEGSYSGVMGLPLFETAQLLQEFQIATGLEPRLTHE